MIPKKKESTLWVGWMAKKGENLLNSRECSCRNSLNRAQCRTILHLRWMWSEPLMWLVERMWKRRIFRRIWAAKRTTTKQQQDTHRHIVAYDFDMELGLPKLGAWWPWWHKIQVSCFCCEDVWSRHCILYPSLTAAPHFVSHSKRNKNWDGLGYEGGIFGILYLSHGCWR